MTPIILIPTRMAATRLPGKPLADIGGIPMILRAWRRATDSDLGRVVVAAGDAVIVEAIEAAGGEACLTDPDLPSGSDRIMAALAQCDPNEAHDIIINLQGDMPFVSRAALRACIEIFYHIPDCDVATVVAPEISVQDRSHPDVVKAILALSPGETVGRALYFTRSTLYGDGPIWRHVGLYGYRRDALLRFTASAPTPLERRESLEQLRGLELGLTYWAAIIDSAPISVDNPADLATARDQAAYEDARA